MIPKLTGNLFCAGRALAGLTRDDLATRAGLEPVVGTILPKSAPPSIRSVESSNGTAQRACAIAGPSLTCN